MGAPCGARCTDTQIGWEFINIARNVKGGLPYQPWAAELVKKRKADLAKDDPNVRCMPRGALRIWTDDYYKRIFQTPDRWLILTERNMQYRQIFTDGRPLPPDPNPTWNGYSTAKWEGDTLVVPTIGFRDDLWLDSDGNPDPSGEADSAHRLICYVTYDNLGEATFFWKNDPGLDTPDLQSCQIEFPLPTPETATRFDVPEFGWGALMQPLSSIGYLCCGSIGFDVEPTFF